MKKMLHNGALAVVLALFCLALFCTDYKNDNPTAASYTGDYSLKLSWKSGTEIPEEIFKHYRILCAHGTDTFPQYLFDPVKYPMVLDSTLRGKTDTLVVHFYQPYNDTSAIIIQGIRPNKLIVTASISANVINPYSISCNHTSVIKGQPATASLRRSDNLALGSGFNVVWRINGVVDSVSPNSVTSFDYTPKNSGTDSISAILRDSAGRECSLAAVPLVIRATSQKLSSAKIQLSQNLGDPLTVVVKQENPNGSQTFYLFATNANGKGWKDSAKILNDTAVFKRPVIDTAPQLYSFYSVDENGFKSNTLQDSGKVKFTLPVVLFTVTDTIIIPYNDSTLVSISQNSTGEKFIWVLDSDTLKPDSLNPKTHMIFLPDTFSQHSLKVTGIDHWGYAGLQSSIPVRAQKFAYTIFPSAFPTEVKAKALTMWNAGIKNPLEPLKNGAHYHWGIDKPLYDSMQISGADSSILWLRWPDSTHTTVYLWVVDSVGKDLSAHYSKPVTVRQYAPEIKITTSKPDSGKTTEPITITVIANDSNSDGTIKKIIWHRSDSTASAFDTTDGFSRQFTFKLPGTYFVTAKAKDNDGFLSKPDSIYIVVKAYIPYISPVMPTITVFVNTPVTLTVSGNASDTSAKITKYVWDFDGNGTWDTTTSVNTMTHSFAKVGENTVIVKCGDSKLQESVPDSFIVTVSGGAPQLPTMKHDTIWIDDDTLYTFQSKHINPLATLTNWFVKWDATGSYTNYNLLGDTVVIKHKFTSKGPNPVSYYVADDHNDTSFTVNDTVFVHQGTPVVKSITLDTATTLIFINDMRHFLVRGADTNGHIDSIQVSCLDDSNFTGTKIVQTGDSATFAYSFATSGTKKIRFRVFDDDGQSADMLYTINVLLGTPAVSSVIVDTSASKNFINLPVKIAVHGHDANGHIDSIKIAWNGDSSFSPRVMATNDTAAFTNSYSTSGVKQIRVRVYDNDALSAETTISFYVHTGRPKMVSITPDSLVFINDARTFAIATFDSNGTVDSVKIDNGSGSFGTFLKTNNGSYSLARIFARSEAGSKTIRAFAKDNDGLLTDTMTIAVSVRLGTPVIDSMHVPFITWINDDSTYRVFARDTNGTITKYYFDWLNNGTWQDSSTTGSAVTHFATAGVKTVRIGILDNDTLLTTSTKQITVHLGVPRVWNPGGDTMFVVTPAGGGNDTLRISHLDSNGTIPTFYWAMNPVAGLDTSHTYSKGPADTLVYNINGPAMDIAQKMAVFGKDDDGNVAGDTFFLYPDAPPPAPVITVDKPSGQIRIGWLGKDVKDGNGTMFKILLKKGSAPATTDVLIDFTAGTSLSPGQNSYDFSYRFTPSGGNGTYYYQVIAKDARGSISSSATSFFNFP